MLTYLNIYGATHQESEDGAEDEEEVPVIGFWSGFVWLVGMTIIIALLSEYVVATIEVKIKKAIFIVHVWLRIIKWNVRISCIVLEKIYLSSYSQGFQFLSGCIKFLGLVSQLPQHNLATNYWKCSRTCRGSHICFQEQDGE